MNHNPTFLLSYTSGRGIWRNAGTIEGIATMMAQSRTYRLAPYTTGDH